MGCVNKEFIKFIVENIGDILEYQEVRTAIINYDMQKKNEEIKKAEKISKLKQAKIDIEEQKNNLEEYNKRVIKSLEGTTFKLFYEDLIVNYLYTLKANGIEPEIISQEEAINYGGLIINYLKEKGINVILDLDDMEINDFYKKHSAFFQKIENDGTLIVGDLTTADLSKLFHVYLPYEIMPAITDEKIRKTVRERYKGSNKKYAFKNKKED